MFDVLKFFTCVVGFNGLGGDNDAGVTTLNVLALIRNRTSDVTTGEGYTGGKYAAKENNLHTFLINAG